jgi:hypothetical protein
MSQTTVPETLVTLEQRLHILLDERMDDPAVVVVNEAAQKAWRGGRWTVPVVTALINRLLAIPVPEPVVAPEPKVRSNTFDAVCNTCGTLVQAGTGILSGSKGAWVVEHAEGDHIPEGRYAVDFNCDDNVKFFQLIGKEVYAQASDELHLLNGAEYITQVLSAIRADVKGAAALYGHKTEHCGICGRTLTLKESRLRGIGPVCAEKNGWL